MEESLLRSCGWAWEDCLLGLCGYVKLMVHDILENIDDNAVDSMWRRGRPWKGLIDTIRCLKL